MKIAQAIRPILTILALLLLIWFGVDQSRRDNQAAFRHLLVIQPNQQLKQGKKEASDSNDKDDDVSKVVGIATLVVLLVQSGIFARQVGIMYRQADIYDRQADLMEGQLAAAKATVPRAWLYAEFNEPRTDVTTQGLSVSSGGPAVVSLSIWNHGTIPATIKQVDFSLYFGGFDDGRIFNPEQELVNTPFEIGEIGKATAPIRGAVESKFTFSPYMFEGRNVSPNQYAPEDSMKRMIQFNHPAFKQSGYPVFRGRETYIFIIIKYGDPNGANRETGYLGYIRANDRHQVVQINDPRYSYHR